MARRGVLPHPRKKLNPAFRRRYQESLRDRHVSALALASAIGFSRPSHLSHLIHARDIPGTPLVLGRMRRVAELIGFDGDPFEAAQ
jgi:hypothetical protein